MDPKKDANETSGKADKNPPAAKTVNASKAVSTTTSNIIKAKIRDDAAQEASERRRIWTMAAASAAEMIKELTQKEPPKFDDVTKVFAPITPGEWAEKRLALDALREAIDDMEEVSDAQIAEELFYDPDANDDDLVMFLGSSDKDIRDGLRGSISQSPKLKGVQRKSIPGDVLGTAIGGKPAITEKPTEVARRKSSVVEAEEADTKRRSSQVSNLSGSSEKELSAHESHHSRQSQGDDGVPTVDS